MGLGTRQNLVIAAAGLSILLSSASSAMADSPPTSVTINQGFGTLSGIHEVSALQWDFTDAYFTGVMVSHRLFDTGVGLSFDIEGHINRHYGSGDYWEGVAAVGARWDRFPWSERLYTGLAVTTGVSYNTGRSGVEETRQTKTSRSLQYLGIEIEAAPSADSPWSVTSRLHHRSGAFGLHNGVVGGSNYFSVGLRRRF